MKYCKNQIFSLIVVLFYVIVLIVISFLLFTPYMWEDDFLGKWASVVTILSLIGIPITYFLKQHTKEKEQKQQVTDERNLASRNLYGELHDALQAIYGKKYPQDLLDIFIKDTTLTFTNRFLNHDMYDALIFSGKISFLRYELQQKIQDVFKKIKHHNSYLKYILELQDRSEGEEIPANTYRYYRLLDSDEKALLDEIPIVMKKLKDEFEFETPT